MNRQDIIRMAREAGFDHIAEADYWHPLFERFASLVASAERESLRESFRVVTAAEASAAILHEREACAEIAEKQRYAMNISLTSHPVQNGTAVGIANAIRARGQA